MTDMSLYQQVIHQTRYARWNEEAKRRETWDETTQRYVDYFDKFLQDTRDYTLSDKIKASVHKALYGMDIMPSMRTFMTAGKALDSAPVSAYNCAYLVVDSVRSFSEHMYVLMCGTGSGFSVEKRFVDKLPEVPSELHPTDTVIVVADSRKGWCVALNQLMNLLYAGSIPKWDVSKVRPEGARLKTFGGYSSGPGVLEELFRHIIKTFEGAKGRKMRPIEVFSIMTYIAQIVVVGGVRRSATICLFDKDDAEMRVAKSGQWWVNNGHFAMANISAVFEGRPRSTEFMDVWKTLVASGSGEPGVLNRKALWDDAESIGRETREPNGARIALGVNPSLRSGTRVLTAEGVYPIESLAGKDILVPNLDGAMSPAKCFLSGKDKPLWEITLKNGQVFYATAEHEWPVYDTKSNTVHKRRTPQLSFGDGLLPTVHTQLPFGTEGDYEDGFVIGWNLGDGWITERDGGIQIGFIVSEGDGDAPKNRIEKYLSTRCGWNGSFEGKSEINVNNQSLRDIFEKFGVGHKSKGLPSSVWTTASESFRKGIIDGLFSSDGSADERGIGLFSSHSALVKDVQELLGLYGINTSITHRTLSDVEFPNGKTYDRTYESYALRTRSKDMVQRFGSLFSLTHAGKQKRLIERATGESRNYRDLRYVESVRETDLQEDVWDITVYDNTHCFHLCGVVTGNCSEISLRPNEFCNLTGASIRPEDTLETLLEKVKLATILGTWQACIDDFDYLRKVWTDNVEDERLLGVCLAGIMDHPVLSKQTDESAEWYQKLRDVAWETNKTWAKRLKINTSASVTAIKPAGNCRPWYSLVTTDDGIFSMEDFAYTHATGVVTPRGSVVGFNDNGDENLLRVKTRYGFELDCTANHRWLTQRGMVEARDLLTSDEIIVEIGKYTKTAHASLRSLPAEALRTRYKQIEPVSLPSEMSTDLAWLLGYLWGDGAMSINGYRIRFMDQNRDHLRKASGIIKNIFGLDSNVSECTDRDAAILEVGNKLLWHWLMVNEIIKYAHSDRESLEMMPLAVRRSSREDIIAFIAGMFDADGHSHTNSTGQTRAIFSNSKDGFSASFQHIALSVGLVFGRSLSTHGENFQNKKHIYMCALSPKSEDSALELFLEHSIKMSKSGFKRRRDQKSPTFAVNSVEAIGYAPVFDVTTDTGEYLSGAFVSHNSGELHNVASGIHPRYAPYYIRTIRQSAGDPMTQFLKDNGIPWEVSKQNPRDIVFSFPIKSPEGAVCAQDLSAIEQLDHWMHVKTNYTTHTVSCTVYVRDHEWMEVGAWVYANFDKVTGISFLPYDDHTYQQAPYQPITHDEYVTLEESFPKTIDWGLLAHYEGGTDTTTVSQDYACVSGACALT